jgi:hypothetical protein
LLDKNVTVSPLLVFFSGVGVSLVGTLLAHFLTRERERRRIVEDRRFEIFMKLMDLLGVYWWFTTAEFHRKPVSDEVRRKCRKLSWQIADLLRAADDIEDLEQILDVLMGPSFPTAKERYDAMSMLIDRLGSRVNPRYAKKIRQISEANIRQLRDVGISDLGAIRDSNVPGST